MKAKNRNYLFLLSFLILMSCSVDETPDINQELIGKWRKDRFCFASFGSIDLQCLANMEKEILHLKEKGEFVWETDEIKLEGEFTVEFLQPDNTPEFINIQPAGNIVDPFIFRIEGISETGMSLSRLELDRSLRCHTDRCYDRFKKL